MWLAFVLAYRMTGLQALEEALENRNHKQISTNKLLKMAQFVLKINFFEFNNDIFNRYLV